MLVSDVLNSIYPFTNTKGITYIMPKYSLISTINDAINLIFNYKGYIWTWQITKETLDNSQFTETNIHVTNTNLLKYDFELSNPVQGFNSIYVKYEGQNNFVELDIKRDLTGTFNKGNINYKFLDKNISLVSNKKITDIEIIYIRGHDKVINENDEIKLPIQFITPIKYFTLQFVTPVFPTVDAGRERNYQQIAIDIIESMKLQDSNHGQKIHLVI